MATSHDQQQLRKCAHAECDCMIGQGSIRYCSPECEAGKTPCTCGHFDCRGREDETAKR